MPHVTCRLHAADEPVQLGGGAREAPLAGGGGGAPGGRCWPGGAPRPQHTGRGQLRGEGRDGAQTAQGNSVDRWVSGISLVKGIFKIIIVEFMIF